MSCGNGNSSINETFIIEPLSITGGSPTLSACTTMFTNEVSSCSGDSKILMASGATVFNTTITPTTDDTINLGLPSLRFRSVNTVNGTSTYWTATTSVTTAMIDLGLDSGGDTRQITANNSIIHNDVLLGGTY